MLDQSEKKQEVVAVGNTYDCSESTILKEAWPLEKVREKKDQRRAGQGRDFRRDLLSWPSLDSFAESTSTPHLVREVGDLHDSSREKNLIC